MNRQMLCQLVHTGWSRLDFLNCQNDIATSCSLFVRARAPSRLHVCAVSVHGMALSFFLNNQIVEPQGADKELLYFATDQT